MSRQATPGIVSPETVDPERPVPSRGDRRRTLVIVAALALACLSGVVRNAQAQRILPGGPPLPSGDSTVLVMLGTGAPLPSPERSGPATAVLVGHRVFLFDAGPGVVRRMAAAGLPIDGVTAAFITHLHSDHTLGLPDLVLTTWVMGRRIPMRMYGPPGLRQMTEHILAAWSEDTTVRITGLEHAAPGGYRVDVHETTGGVVYDSGGVRITAIPVPHSNWKHAFGYRIDTPTRHVVVSGDTRYSEALQRAATDVDVLVHEAYVSAHVVPEQRPGGESWPEYLDAAHTSDEELGRLAAAARPKLLVLTHVVWQGGSEAELLAGIRRGGYAGPVVVARDLDRF